MGKLTNCCMTNGVLLLLIISYSLLVILSRTTTICFVQYKYDLSSEKDLYISLIIF